MTGRNRKAIDTAFVICVDITCLKWQGAVCKLWECVICVQIRDISLFLTAEVVCIEQPRWLIDISVLFVDSIGSIRNYKESLCISNSALSKLIPNRLIPVSLKHSKKRIKTTDSKRNY
ncbi:hypothetical protein GJ496_001754 [Pomphorhynchus laevis]|nr:hypothetical protein GJ496_001754 [Pomphorhynchus laevis]